MRLLVVGDRGSGKTAWCREYICRQRKSGSTVGGIICPAVYRQGQRVGYNALALLTGQEMPFARLRGHQCFEQGETVGDYIVSREAILFACAAIRRAVESRCDLVVIDEVGPLELSGKGLMPAVELALASPLNVLVVVRSSLKEALETHFPECEFVVAADLTGSASRGSGFADPESDQTPSRCRPREACQAEEPRQN